MKIAWVTPLAQTSAIGRVSVHICEALAKRGHTITLVRSEFDEQISSKPHTTSLPTVSWKNVDVADLSRRHDVMFVNIGDNYLFHAGIFPFLEAETAIGVFHDYFLFNLFLGWIHHQCQLEPERYINEIVNTYGASALMAAEGARTGEISLSEIASQIPMTEWIAKRCAGAIAHSQFYVPRLEGACFGPVTVAALPWQGRDIPALRRGKPRPLTAVTVGVGNPNKCAEQIIQAISLSNKLRDSLSYVMAGSISAEYRVKLIRMAEQNGVHLTITGELDDAALVKVLSNSDIICCFRKPVLEGASASAIEGMLAGRPVVVADAGFYADLPEDCVFKVSEKVEPQEVCNLLERLVDNEHKRIETGTRASQWAQENFTISAYASAIEGVVEQEIRYRPLRILSGRIASHFSSLDIDASSELIDRVGGIANEMFGAVSSKKFHNEI